MRQKLSVVSLPELLVRKSTLCIRDGRCGHSIELIAFGMTSSVSGAEEGLEHLKKQFNLQESFTASYEKVVDEVSEALQATSAANRSALALLRCSLSLRGFREAAQHNSS